MGIKNLAMLVRGLAAPDADFSTADLLDIADALDNYAAFEKAQYTFEEFGCEYCINPLPCEKCTGFVVDTEKLEAHLEQYFAWAKARDEGRLVELICKPGDVVWYSLDNQIRGSILAAQNGECAIVTASPCGYEGTISEYLKEETLIEGYAEIRAIPLTSVFLTRAEAEAAMQEEGGEAIETL